MKKSTMLLLCFWAIAACLLCACGNDDDCNGLGDSFCQDNVAYVCSLVDGDWKYVTDDCSSRIGVTCTVVHGLAACTAVVP